MLSRRGVLRLALGASTALASQVAGLRTARAEGGPRLYVFVPTDMGVQAFQKLLAESMPNINVVAFGRYRDFETGLADNPDGVLTLEPILRAKQLRPTVMGNNGAGPAERYALISVDQPVEPASVASVGAVDILGRQGMKELISSLIGTSPKIERVTKVEDLLPLLQLASVDAVLAPERFVHSLQARSKLDLRTTRTQGAVGLPGLTILTAAGAPLAQYVRRLGRQVSQEMGVTKWD